MGEKENKNKMLRGTNFIILMIVAIVLSSCKTATFNDRIEVTVVASVGKYNLYLRDVPGLNSPNLTKEDSSVIVSNYARTWVRNKSVDNYSEKRYRDKSEEINKLVEDYRHTLLTGYFERDYTKKISTNVSEKEILEYYNREKSNFALTNDLIKARVMIIPSNYVDLAVIKKKFSSSNDDDEFQDIISIGQRDDFVVRDMSKEWNNFGDLLSFVSLKTSSSEMLKKNGVFEYKVNNLVYIVKIIDRRLKGSATPLEFVSDMIKRSIIVERRRERLKHVRDSIYENSFNRGETVIFDVI